jgi:ComF family protein
LNTSLKRYLQGFFCILYPRTCAACGNVLYYNENVLCFKCYIELPRTRFHDDPDNEVARLFWGRIPVKNATSFIYFDKESRYKNILHELKYKGQQQVGIEMGRLFGLELRETSFAMADLIIPIPLHYSKYHKRGYNQSALIATGLSEVLKIPLRTDMVSRLSNTSSQTSKSRFERWINVQDKFYIQQASAYINKHILLVDDVITTGATMEACANALLSVTGVTFSIASLAYTKLQQ